MLHQDDALSARIANGHPFSIPRLRCQANLRLEFPQGEIHERLFHICSVWRYQVIKILCIQSLTNYGKPMNYWFPGSTKAFHDAF